MLFITVLFDFFLSWLRDNPAKVVSVVAVTFVGGYSGIYLSEMKSGIIIHDQGYELQDPDGDGIYNLWLSDIDRPQYSSKDFDIWNNPKDCAEWTAQVGIDRFGEKWGCSYALQCWGDSYFQFQKLRAITAHASGWNSFSIGVMLARTDNPEYNEKTLRTFTEVVYPMIVDSVASWGDNSKIEFCLFHMDVATNGKTDPRPFKLDLEDMGYRYDDRPFPLAESIEPYDYLDNNDKGKIQ